MSESLPSLRVIAGEEEGIEEELSSSYGLSRALHRKNAEVSAITTRGRDSLGNEALSVYGRSLPAARIESCIEAADSIIAEAIREIFVA